MGNFNDIVNKAKELANIAGKKTNEVISISKLKMEQINMNSDLQKKYESLGVLCYNEYKSASDDSVAIKQLIQEIDALSYKIDEHKDDISKMKNMKVCQNCGNKNPKTSIYCNACGNALYPNNGTTSDDGPTIDVEYRKYEENENPKNETIQDNQ